MQDWKINLRISTNTVAYIAWITGATLILCDLFAIDDDLGHLGIVIAAVGHLVHIRAMFCSQAAHMKQAFELGRDAGRLEAVPNVPPQRIH